MKEKIEMPTLMRIFDDGFESEVVRALLDALAAYGFKLGTDSVVCSDIDSDNIYFLIEMLRSILQDRYGLKL